MPDVSPAATSAAALRLTNLRKAYGRFVATDRIELTVPAGAFYGLLGAEGSGKSTVLSMATGLLRPDDGTVEVFDVDLWSDPLRAKPMLGAVPDESSAVPEQLTGRELLAYTGMLRGLDPATIEARATDVLAVLGLTARRDLAVGDYPPGARKSLYLATALLHAPKLLVLDEPFQDIDPLFVATMKAVLQRFVAGGGTVLLASAKADLVEALCDHVAVLVGGRMAAEGTMAEVCAGERLESALAHASVPADKGVWAWLSS